MTALILQGNKEARVTANRSLEQFLSERRAKMFGLEVPEDHNQIEINGLPASGWNQMISDGDRVILNPNGRADDVEGDAGSIVNHVDSADTDGLQARITDLEDERNNLRDALSCLTNGSLTDIEARLILIVENAKHHIEDLNTEVASIENVITELASLRESANRSN